ncbi:PREDICTED: uncharacterized protein LOC109353664 [Lupinus angustifolius]|uniref:uncharacterized protein LOC109353664 n=1 Tax=Lupinus angustifolius TaxID=3871 RepID=UPI00092F6E62|nr:PREDICTED: uncharacterized protein LOC109353664 [Lupinus angustifolius]
MEVVEIPKLNLNSSCSESLEREEKNMGSEKISVSEQINGYQYEESESFVVDMDSFSPRINNKDTKPNSRIARNLPRKGSQRGVDRKVNGNATLYDGDPVSATSSPKASLLGSNWPEKTAVAAVGSPRHSTNTQVHHQITITAGNIINNNNTESKSLSRRYSFKRPSSWLLDPKRVVLFCATLSCMGTMLLIYFTLVTSKENVGEYGGD